MRKKSFILVNFFTIGKNALVSNILGMQPYEVVKANHIILNLQMRKTKLGEVKWFAWAHSAKSRKTQKA